MAWPRRNEFDWAERAFVYRHIVEHERPPTVDETAVAFGIGVDEARAAYERLHDRHALFLDPQSRDVRMANPIAGRPTSVRVLAKAIFRALGLDGPFWS
ncbi:MAG: hypothetical protein ACRDJW_14430 [Thermomicrobiales bacterium]